MLHSYLNFEEIWKYGEIGHIKREVPIELGD